MSTASENRLLIEPSGSRGSWNMAVDEFLLQRALKANELAVRVYSWETATVSLGYFQSSEEFQSSGRFALLPVVRRLSGGGAILHDREITYSIAIPPGHPLAADPGHLYEIAHAAITDVLNATGVTLAPRGRTLSDDNEPFLCFSRGDRNDLVLSGVKVVGSAQRRRKGAVLQHGSILLEASPHAPELPGIRDLVASFEPGNSLATAIGETIFWKLLQPESHSGIDDRNAAGSPSSERSALSREEKSQIRDLEIHSYSHIDQLRTRTSGPSLP